MAEQFGLRLGPAVITAMADLFPAASDRDFKGLVKLTAKYRGRKKTEPSPAVFRRCALFRGIGRDTPAV